MFFTKHKPSSKPRVYTNTKPPTKKNPLSRLSTLSKKAQFLVFILVFAALGGGYYAYRSFAAAPLCRNVTLRQGTKEKECTRHLQDLLRVVYKLDPGPSDGIYGAKTTAAVKAFEQSPDRCGNGCLRATADGAADPTTAAHLCYGSAAGAHYCRISTGGSGSGGGGGSARGVPTACGRPLAWGGTSTTQNGNGFDGAAVALRSNNGVYTLTFQEDGNLVIYRNCSAVVWASNTAKKGATSIRFQNDGNLVLYAGSRAIWATNTSGGRDLGFFETPYRFTLSETGELRISAPNGRMMWTSLRGRL